MPPEGTNRAGKEAKVNSSFRFLSFSKFAYPSHEIMPTQRSEAGHKFIIELFHVMQAVCSIPSFEGMDEFLRANRVKPVTWGRGLFSFNLGGRRVAKRYH